MDTKPFSLYTKRPGMDTVTAIMSGLKRTSALRVLATEMERELRRNILPFWPRFIDPRGGFYGNIENDGKVDPQAAKGLVMHARQLWTYASAARALEDAKLLSTAKAAFDFMVEKLYDRSNRGFFWAVDPEGKALPPHRKVIYGQAFAIYSLSEYARAGGPAKALELAFETFGLLSSCAADGVKGGYFEACAADWSRAVPAPLSSADITCDKSMNTNLHVMEALSSLYAASKDRNVLDALRAAIEIHMDRILVSPEHLGLYFTKEWVRLDEIVSFGHDIEASWLITEAAGHAWEGGIPQRIRDRVLAVAAGTARVLDENGGSLPNELRGNRVEPERIWWVQAEAIVGMVNAWELSGDSGYLDRAAGVWDFVKKHIVDNINGEWLWGAHADGRPLEGTPKGGMWKAGYHNGRACMEIMARARERSGTT
jgi:mannobiose 2-epimerase